MAQDGWTLSDFNETILIMNLEIREENRLRAKEAAEARKMKRG